MKRIRILFLEDKQQDFNLAVAQLERSGIPFNASMVDNKEDFRKALRTLRPDVIIVECLLPRFNGLNALRLARKHDDTVPVIIFSDLADEKHISGCIQAGATDFVHKEHLARLSYSISEALKLKSLSRRQKKTEMRLRKERNLFLTITSTSPVGKTIVDRDGSITYVNRKGAEILGYSADEIRTRSYNSPNWEITDADGNPFPEEQLPFRQVKRTGKPVFEVEHAISWPDGRRVLLSINASPLFDEKGEFDGMVATLNDVTGLRQAEKALVDNERKYRLLFETMMNGFALHEIVLDPEGKPVDYIFLEANKAFLDLTETGKAIIGKRVTELIPGIESDPADWIGLYGRVAMQDKEYRFEQFSRELKKWFSVYAFSPQQGQFVTVFEEITARKESEDKLRESEQRYRELFENMSSGVAIYKAVDGGKDFIFTGINRAGEKMDNVDRSQLTGKSVLEAFPAVREFGLLEVFRRVWETGQAETLAEAHYEDERISCWRNNFVYKLQSSEIVAIYDDITEKHKAEQELIEARKKAEESDRLKTAFLQNLSHEIRTPMNGIIGFSELLSDPTISAEDHEKFTRIISKECHQLLGVITDIVEISRIETGEIDTYEMRTPVNQLLTSLKDRFIPAAEEKDLSLELVFGLPDKQSVILSDESKLRQVMEKLIMNAIKFTNKGGIRVGYHNKDRQTLQFFIEDTGIGIPIERQSKIFDRFVQAEEYIAPAFGGTGLGLSISKSYIESMGGRIWVNSSPGEGTVFCFTLPYKPVEKEKRTPSEKPGTGKKKSALPDACKVLVVEDEYDNFEYLRILLEHKNIQVLHAENGQEGLRIFQEEPDIDLVLMDIKLPDINGLEVTKAILQINHAVPVIAQTAYNDPDTRRHVLEAGCMDFIAKPINPRHLMEKITNALGG